tara:strand:+ start:4298 stop:4447 length:150 start_codon:yes stop_codon:yes gene_type:complete
MRANFDHTAANSKVIELIITVSFFITDGQGTWNGQRDKMLMPRKHSNLT